MYRDPESEPDPARTRWWRRPPSTGSRLSAISTTFRSFAVSEMEEGAASESSSSPWAPIFDALKLKGWCFRDAHHLPSSLEQAMAAAGKSFEMGTSSLVELELLNMDLREFGGRCLTDPSSLKKSAYFHGPKVLQVRFFFWGHFFGFWDCCCLQRFSLLRLRLSMELVLWLADCFGQRCV